MFSWLYHRDENYSSIEYQNIFSNSSTLESVSQLFDQVDEYSKNQNEKIQKIASKHWTLSKNLLQSYLIPKCPPIDKIKQSLADEALIFTIYSYEGYNFSSEYTLVYRGEFSKVRVYDDLLAVVQKALVSIEPTISQELLSTYSTYIIRRTSWEVESIANQLKLITQQQFPKLKQFEYTRNLPIQHVRIFLGYNTQYSHLSPSTDVPELFFTVRIEDEYVLTEKTPKVIPMENLIKFIFYHDFRLTQRIAMTYNELMSNTITIEEIYKNKELKSILEEELLRYRMYWIFPSIDDEKKTLEILTSSKKEEEQQPSETTPTSPIDSNSTFPSIHISNASHCSDVYGWGYDAYFSLALGDKIKRKDLDEVFDPRPIPISRNISVEKVRMIACSSKHTLLITHFGSVYGCGDNSEGALGLSDLLPRQAFTLIEWTPPNQTHSPVTIPPKIVYIAAGSGVLGSHSAAIDSEGKLYSWGLSKASGLSSTTPVPHPKQVVFQNYVETNEEGIPTELSLKIRKVVCGDCFTVCLATNGEVYSWGQWTHGRLGIGPIPKLRSNIRRTNTSKLARFQLSPARVLSIDHAIDIACGESHALCLLNDGRVLAWGQNSLGQLGVGPSRTGLLKDAFSPVLLSTFGQEKNLKVDRTWMPKDPNHIYVQQSQDTSSNIPIKQVFCGSFHSIVVDIEGRCWSWGARGSPCLGQGDSPLTGEWAGKINGLFSLSTTETHSMIPYELYNWVLLWSMPRLVQALNGIKASHVIAGDLHTAVLSDRGTLYLCGSGPVVPAFTSTTLTLLDENESSDKATEEGEVSPGRSLRDRIKGVVVNQPRCPSSSWLRDLSTRNIEYLGGGACRMFVIQDEEYSVTNLTAYLHRKLIHGENDGLVTGDEESIDSSKLSDYTSGRHQHMYYESRAKADCMVIASGHIFLCHKALLAQRSIELRNMIIMESPTDGSQTLVQLLLPELNGDAARVLFYFLYRDQLPNWCIGNSSLLSTLSRCGKTLKMPRLTFLAERFLAILTGKSGGNNMIRSITEDHMLEEMPPMTLSKDLGTMIGDIEFADIRFVTEGRSVAAHRFILENRCEYFKMMFKSGMNESNVIDVVVPDTFVGFLRLLIFIYTNSLPDGSDGALLEDLMAADRYGLHDMKSLCEDMLIPTQENWIDLLRAAELLNSIRLKQSVISFMSEHYLALQLDKFLPHKETDETTRPTTTTTATTDDETISTTSEEIQTMLHDLYEEFPLLSQEIIKCHQTITPHPPSHLLINQMKESKEVIVNAQKPAFPFVALIIAAISLFLYQHISKIISLGPLIPALNIVLAIFFAYYVYHILSQ